MKFFKKNNTFILGIFVIAIASLFSLTNTFAWQADKDPGFEIWSWFDGGLKAIAIQDDGKIILWGSFNNYQWVGASKIIRLNPDLSRDYSFDIGNGFSNAVETIVIQSDGKILVGWFFGGYNWITSRYIARLNPDWSIDDSFHIGDGMFNGFNWSVTSIAIQGDGKIIIAGTFTTYQLVAANRIIRLNADWSRDYSFDIGDGFDYEPYSIVIQDDDKIVVWWRFNNYQWISASKIIRLDVDWSRDYSFDVWSWFNHTVNSIEIQDDGKFVVWWWFAAYQWVDASKIIRLNTDWSRDYSFDMWSGFGGVSYNTVYSIAIQDDWRFVILGGFVSYQWVAANRVIRLNTDWSRDYSFDIGNGLDNDPRAIAIQDSGKVLVGGWFTSYKDKPILWYLIALKGNNPLIIPASGDVNEFIDRFTYRWYTLTGWTLSWSTPFSLSESNWKITTDLNILSNW